MVLLGSVRFLALQNVKARIPLIQFRKGAPTSHDHNTSTDATDVSYQAQRTSAYSTEAIEDWQLPPRFRRQIIDDYEVDYINRGGPD